MKMIVRFKEKSASENKQTEVSRQLRSSFTVGRFSKYFGDKLDFQSQLVKTSIRTRDLADHFICFVSKIPTSDIRLNNVR